MGLDLSLVDVAAAVYQYERCRDSGKPCHHDPNCAERYQAVSVIDPWEFRYRQFVTVREIDEALAAYAKAPESHRAELESRPKWVAWLEWLALSREHGGFEVE